MRYSDNVWHQLIAWRDENVAYIAIDNTWTGLENGALIELSLLIEKVYSLHNISEKFRLLHCA
ncbi:hypothetical protein DPMN_089010 [Dreissena polymorpha]|uniref:Uncharacterized protein n=1 Tax=Dreissena polymorpha TaxID=45954 RepID=A0A9D4KW19_DREPO|nr:hypothetical protein DPMN_089010 [Dreissena polymorpha]